MPDRKPDTHSAILFLALLAIIALVAGLSASSYERFRREAETTARNLAEIISDDIEGTLTRAESDLHGFAAFVGPDDLSPKTVGQRRRAEIESLMAAHLVRFPQIVNYRIFSADGATIFGAGKNPAKFNVSDREWFRSLKADASKQLAISDVLIGKGMQTPTVILGVPIRTRDGRFIGAVNAALDLTHFQSLIDGPEVGPNGLIAVRRSETSKLILRRPYVEDRINESAISTLTLRILNGERSGVTDFVSVVDGVVRTTAFRRTDNYPVVTIVGLAHEDILRPWAMQTAIAAAVTLIFEIVLVALFARQRRTQKYLEAARVQAEAANHAKSQFLATMSHEIRTPMNGVLGMAQLLLMPGISEQERYEYARTILNSGQTLLTLLNDILDLSKVEAGKFELAYAAFDPRQTITEATALFAESAQAKGLRIDIDWHGPQGQRYRADPIRLRQMLSNLISNAIKFTAQGFVRVEAREVERADGGAVLEFAVTDSGIGVPVEKQGLLFKPFTQIDDSSTREYGGTGLGLSIVRSLAALMGGEVGVTSEMGRGSCFWFRIRAELLDAEQESRRLERGAEAGANALPRTTRRILLVEDNVTNRKVIVALLGKLNCRIESVGNGQEALDAVRHGVRPDLVLMDVQMPVMDGLAATEHIRRWEGETHQPRLPIVALTAGAFEDDHERCIAAGMDDYLVKPINMDDLAMTIDKWIGKGT